MNLKYKFYIQRFNIEITIIDFYEQTLHRNPSPVYMVNWVNQLVEISKGLSIKKIVHRRLARGKNT